MVNYYYKRGSEAMLTKELILEELKSISKEFRGIRFGLAGSYSRGEETEKSDIDIVSDYDYFTLEEIDKIKSHFAPIDVDLLCLGLLQKDDIELDTLMLTLDIPINDSSVYKSVLREVIWCEKEL